MKTYISYRPDLANEAAVQAVVDANPTAYVVGTVFIDAAGAMHYVKTNDGTTVVLATVTTT
jgi:uncharacterized protein GlcG (DUF336 family)